MNNCDDDDFAIDFFDTSVVKKFEEEKKKELIVAALCEWQSHLGLPVFYFFVSEDWDEFQDLCGFYIGETSKAQFKILVSQLKEKGNPDCITKALLEEQSMSKEDAELISNFSLMWKKQKELMEKSYEDLNELVRENWEERVRRDLECFGEADVKKEDSHFLTEFKQVLEELGCDKANQKHVLAAVEARKYRSWSRLSTCSKCEWLSMVNDLKLSKKLACAAAVFGNGGFNKMTQNARRTSSNISSPSVRLLKETSSSTKQLVSGIVAKAGRYFNQKEEQKVLTAAEVMENAAEVIVRLEIELDRERKNYAEARKRGEVLYSNRNDGETCVIRWGSKSLRCQKTFLRQCAPWKDLDFTHVSELCLKPDPIEDGKDKLFDEERVLTFIVSSLFINCDTIDLQTPEELIAAFRIAMECRLDYVVWKLSDAMLASRLYERHPQLEYEEGKRGDVFRLFEHVLFFSLLDEQTLLSLSLVSRFWHVLVELWCRKKCQEEKLESSWWDICWRGRYIREKTKVIRIIDL